MTVELVPDDASMPPPIHLVNGEPTFDDLAATMPETAQGFLDDVDPRIDFTPTSTSSHDGGSFLGDTTNTVDDPAPVVPKKRKSLKKLQKALERFQDRLSKWPIAYFNAQAIDHPEWKLTDDEEELIKDSIETVFEVLDVGVDIEPISYTITSVYWVLLYPFAAFAFLFLIKKQASMEREQKENQQ